MLCFKWYQVLYVSAIYVCRVNAVDCQITIKDFGNCNPELVITDLDLDELAGRDLSGWNLPRDWRPDIYGRRSARARGPRPWDVEPS